MNINFERLSAVWREQTRAFEDFVTDEIQSRAGPSYAALPREQMLASSRQLMRAWQQAFDSGDSTSIREFGRAMGQRRSESHVAITEIMTAMDITRECIWQALARAYAPGDWDIDAVAEIERWMHEMRKSTVSSYGETFQQAEQRLAEREQALAIQGRLIQELSVPIVPLHEGILVLPLVGAVDSRRATQVLEAALEKIVEFQTDVLIFDITGVPVVDTGVANYILQMARAVKLLGAQVVLVGIGAEIAQTIVQLGVELRDVTTRSNLQSGIEYALQQQGFAIQPINTSFA